MHCEARFRAVGARTLRAPGNSSGPRTGTCQATDGRQGAVMRPLAASPPASVRPGPRAARAPAPYRKCPADKQPAADRLASAPGDGGLRTDASPLRPPRQAEHSHRQPRRTAPRDRNPARTIPIGLDPFHDWSRPQGSRYQHGFSTRSGNDGKQPARSGQTGHENGPVNSRADRPAFRVHGRYIRRSGYRTSSPVTARPTIIRWISDVPSKMVKIFASRCQRSTGYSRV